MASARSVLGNSQYVREGTAPTYDYRLSLFRVAVLKEVIIGQTL